MLQTVKETLEHCEEVPAGRGLMENFRELVVSSRMPPDLLKPDVAWMSTFGNGRSCWPRRRDGAASILCRQESQQQRDLAEHNYTNYKEVIWKLQHQLDESRRKIQEYQVRADVSGANNNPLLLPISVPNCSVLLELGRSGKARLTSEWRRCQCERLPSFAARMNK